MSEVKPPEHPPLALPLRYAIERGGIWMIKDANGEPVASYLDPAQAKLIVEGVNSHDELVARVRDLEELLRIESLTSPPALEEENAALTERVKELEVQCRDTFVRFFTTFGELGTVKGHRTALLEAAKAIVTDAWRISDDNLPAYVQRLTKAIALTEEEI